MKMFDNQLGDVAVLRQDDGKLHVFCQACTSKTSTDSQNSVSIQEKVKLVERAACFNVGLSLLDENSTVRVGVFLFHLLQNFQLPL